MRVATTRVFFATDVHGSESCFLKLLNSAKLYKATVLVLGGDLTGKTLVPIVREQQEGRYRATFLGRPLTMTSEAEVNTLEKRIRSIGSYPYLTSLEEMEELQTDSMELDQLFTRLIIERLKHWIELAEERLHGSPLKLYITGGNDDPLTIDDVLQSTSAVINPEGATVKIDDLHEMLSCAWTNRTPWKTPRECTEETLYDRLKVLTLQVANMGRCIFNIHAPPIASGLDTCQEIDENLRPVFVHGQPSMKSCGSIAVRRIIEESQPLLGLHGHIHESRGVAKLGRTLCLNPGSEYSEGILRGVIVDLESDRVKSHLFVSG
jgi:Icc-related predicted phosphoesterase